MRQGSDVSAHETVWGQQYGGLSIGLLIIITASAYEALAVATVMPAMIGELGGLAFYGWAFAAFTLANLCGAVLAGAAIDRYGAARPFVFGALLFTVGLLIAGFAPQIAVLLLGRVVQGAGAGFISATAYAAVGRGYPEALRPRMLALFSSAWVVPGLLGPALAGLIGDFIGWRWVFLSVVPLPLLAIGLAAPALRALGASAAPPPARARISAAGGLTLGATLFTAGLSSSATVVRVGLVLGGLALALPALRYLLPAGTLRAAPGLPAAIASLSVLNMVFFGVDAFVPLALSEVRGQSSAFTGLALTAATLAWTAGSWIQASVYSRLPRTLLAGGGLLLVALGSAGIALVIQPWAPVLLAPLAWAVAGLGIGMSYATLSLVVLNESPADQQGASTAALQLVSMLGTALGSGVGGAIVGAAASPAAGIQAHIALMITVALLGVGAALRLGTSHPAPADQDAMAQAKTPA